MSLRKGERKKMIGGTEKKHQDNPHPHLLQAQYALVLKSSTLAGCSGTNTYQHHRPTTTTHYPGIGVGRFRILGGGGARFRILGGGGLNSQQAHDLVMTSMRRNDVASTSFRRHVPTRFSINLCQTITFLTLKSDIIENSRIELKGIVLPAPSNQIKVTFIII